MPEIPGSSRKIVPGLRRGGDCPVRSSVIPNPVASFANGGEGSWLRLNVATVTGDGSPEAPSLRPFSNFDFPISYFKFRVSAITPPLSLRLSSLRLFVCAFVETGLQTRVEPLRGSVGSSGGAGFVVLRLLHDVGREFGAGSATPFDRPLPNIRFLTMVLREHLSD
jgi:hypothetical protein